MKILRIRLTNLNSLRGTHEVDFQSDPLGGAGLFAITGPTGAGKSTLLDAITLALYGRAARYGSTPSPEDMMSRHCASCSAEVVFQVTSGVYRAEWQLRRARDKATGKVQAPGRHVYDEAGQPLTQNVRDTEAMVESLVGLDYARFLRSTLLAQGEFAQFLKARPDERAELLESLTGTAIYSELGTLAHTETTRRESELRLKETSLQNVVLLDEPRRAQIAAEIAAAESILAGTKRALHAANELLAKAGRLQESLNLEKQTLARKAELERELNAAEPVLKRLAAHRLALPFIAALSSLDAAEQGSLEAARRLADAGEQHAHAARETRRCLRDFQHFVHAKTDAASKESEACRQRLESAGLRKATLEEWLREHATDATLADRLPDLVAWLAQLKSSRKALDQAWLQFRNLASRIDPDRSAAPAQPAGELTPDAASSHRNAWLQFASGRDAAHCEARTVALHELRLREDHLAKARLVASLDQHRHSLIAGEPCPLCGALEHPFAEGAVPSVELDALQRRVAEAADHLQALDRQALDLARNRDGLVKLGDDLVTAAHARLTASHAAETALAGILPDLPAPGDEDAARSALQERVVAYRQKASEADRADRDRAAASGDLERLAETFATLREKQSTLTEASAALANPAGEHPAPGASAALRWPSLTAAERDWNAITLALSAADATLETRRKDQVRLAADRDRLASELAGSLAGSPFASIQALRDARWTTTDAARADARDQELKRRAVALDTDLHAAREAIARWRSESTPEGEAAGALAVRRTELQNTHDATIRTLTTSQNLLATDDANRRAAADKQRELEEDRRRLVVWQQLRALIGSHDGRTFRRFAQGLSLDVLVQFANRQLVRLNDRYRLRRREGDDLELEIEDLHQAGAVRPMASLSGGESFLASLALALGLSDIAGRKVRIESLFIDEGFGSLDSDTLDAAIATLESLRQDHKTVGVISHVDLLKERIATQIVVEKLSGGTSRLRVTSGL